VPSTLDPKIETSDVVRAQDVEIKLEGDVMATEGQRDTQGNNLKQESAAVREPGRLLQIPRNVDIKIGVDASLSSVVIKQEDGTATLAEGDPIKIEASSTPRFVSEHPAIVKLEPDQKPDIEAEQEDEAAEEYSRAVPHPDRVILLRQTSERIWFTSISPERSVGPSTAVNNQDQREGIEFAEHEPTPSRSDLEQIDRDFLMDYFRLLPSPSSLTENISGTAEPPSSPLSSPPDDPESPDLGPRLALPLPYQAQYEHWKTFDPLLLGKALDNGWLPRGVRVVRQEGWECLIS